MEKKPAGPRRQIVKLSLLDGFLTPLHKRDGNAAKTPASGSVSKLQFATPAFLRRSQTAPLPPWMRTASGESNQSDCQEKLTGVH